MKKFVALVMAVAMVMSLAAVASAYTLVGPFDYSADKDTISTGILEYGDTVYYALVDDAVAADFVFDYALVEKLKVKVSYEMGEELVENVSLVKKYVDGEGYMYFVAFKTAAKSGVADADVIGTVELSRKALKAEDAVAGFNNGKIDDVEIDFAFNLFYDNTWLDGAKKNTLVEDELTLKWDEEYALKFESDEDVELTFGTEPNEGTFTVDASGQGKVFVKYNTKADEAIAAANPGVKMHFVNFNGAKFNRTGEFMYEFEDGVACYKVVDGALVEIPGAEYDAADEAFYFNTRVLESYVFADAELVNPVVEAPVVEAAPVAPSNPSTGA
jgi:hypothetical protein